MARLRSPQVEKRIVSLLTVGVFASIFVPFSTAQAQQSGVVDCASSENVIEQKHCRARQFFESRGLPLPQCGKHPRTYGERGWRNTKGDLIVTTNKHHQQKRAYCRALKIVTDRPSAHTESKAGNQRKVRIKQPVTNLVRRDRSRRPSAQRTRDVRVEARTRSIRGIRRAAQKSSTTLARPCRTLPPREWAACMGK